MFLFQDDSLRSAQEMIQLRSLAQGLAMDGRTHPEWPQVDFNEQALGFLRSIRNQDSKLPHDKVYGVHSIIRKMKIQLPNPDYSEPLESVLENLTRACIPSLQLDVFTSGLPTTDPPGGLSWIANYLVPESRRDFTRYTATEPPDRSGAIKVFRPFEESAWHNASAGSTAYAAPEYLPGRLQVRGQKMGLLTTVLTCTSEYESNIGEIESFRDFVHKCREWYHACSALPDGEASFKHSLFFNGNDNFDSWRDVIMYPDCSEEARQIIIKSTPPSAQSDAVTVIISYLDYSDKHPAQTSAWLFQIRINAGANWAFVRTDNGHTGRAYRTCREGDELWLLAGSRVPVILREATDGYRYIAPAYF
ncbi:HET-domain-containing protein [Apiospora sp. TS-2023a]